ncbi:MAG: MFS family permease [Gammaproteobacteria bacterium]|jgi:MFS family permease
MNAMPNYFYGWTIVGATFLILFACFGVIYSFGAFFLVLGEEFGVGRAAVSSVFSYAVFALFTSGALGGVIADRTGPKKIMAAGVCAIVAGLLGAANATTLWQLNLCFTFGVGVGIGFVYIPAISTVQRWFIRRRGLASGFAVTGIGVGTLVMPIVAGVLLEFIHWRMVFEFMAVTVAMAGLIAVVLIEADPQVRGLQPDGAALAPDETQLPTRNLNLKPILRSRTFGQFYLAQAILSVPVFVPFVHLVPFAEDIGISRTQAVSVLGLIGLGSTIGRFAVGALADRIGRRHALVIALLGIALAYGIWLAAEYYAHLVIFAIWFGICYGAYVALMPALLADYYVGPKLSSVIGIQYTASALGSIIGPVATGFVFDQYGSYTTALIASGICALLSFYLVLTLPTPVGGAGTP